MNFKEQAGFGSQSHDFSENVPHILDEERIDERVYNFSMFIPWMFLQDNMILHEEMGEELLAANPAAENRYESDYETERNKPMPNLIHGVIQSAIGRGAFQIVATY